MGAPLKSLKNLLWMLGIGMVLVLVALKVWQDDSTLKSQGNTVCLDERGAPYSVGALRRVDGEIVRCNEDGKFGAPPVGK